MPEPSPKKRVALTTLGCKVNQFESAAFLSTLVERGVEVVDFAAPAEVYIVNTCAVTARVAQESRQMRQMSGYAIKLLTDLRGWAKTHSCQYSINGIL